MLTAAVPSSGQSENSVIVPCTNSCTKVSKSGHCQKTMKFRNFWQHIGKA